MPFKSHSGICKAVVNITNSIPNQHTNIIRKLRINRSSDTTI